MTPEQSHRQRDPARAAFAPNETDALGESARIRESDRGAAPRSSADRTGGEVPRGAHRQRAPIRRRFSERPRLRQLGPVEYTLVALIALGVAVTIAMAIFNPSG
jgi:hypothetical protein